MANQVKVLGVGHTYLVCLNAKVYKKPKKKKSIFVTIFLQNKSVSDMY